MSFYFNGAQANVSLDTSQIFQEVKFSYSSSATTGAVTVGTVPANKIWKIIGFDINQGGNVDVTISGGGTNYGKVNGSALNNQSFKLGFALSNGYIDILTAGETIVRTNSQAIGSNVTAYYIEEDA